MQTRTLGLRGIALALAGVLTLGLTACDDTDVVTPPTPSTIQVSPAGPLDLQVGNTVTLVTNVTNPAPGGAQPTYASSNPAVATVSAAGVVTAVAAGTATITVTAQGSQGPLQQGVLVRVTGAPVTPPGPTPTVVIQSIQTATGAAVNTGAASGQIFVRLEVERGNADSLQVRLGTSVVCRQSFVTGASGDPIADAAEFVCPINTAQHPNGPTTLSAHLFRGGAIVASASQPITIANPTTIGVAVTSQRQAINPASGLQWHGGTVTVQATPQNLPAGTTIQTITVQALDSTGVVATRTAGPDSLRVVFPTSGTNSLSGVTWNNVQFRVTAVTAAGTQFTFPDGTQQFTTAGIRYDVVAPTGGTVVTRSFVGTQPLVDLFISADAADPQPGVAGVNYRFFRGTTTQTAAQILAAGNEIQNTADLAEGTVHRILIRACDALQNCVNLSTQDVTVDRTPPSIATVGITQNQIINTPIAAGTTFNVGVQDDESGFNSASALRVTATRLSTTGTQCFNASTGALTAQPCTAVTTSLQPLLPSGTNYGYYTYTIQPVDRAGNVGAAVTRTILYDAVAPTVTAINFPVGTTGGANTTFTATIADNLDLRSYTFGFFFGDPNAAHFGPLPVENVIIDDTFGAPLTTTHSASVTTPYIRGLWSEGTWYPSTNVVFTAQDMARLTGIGTLPIPTQTTSPSLRADVTTFAIVAPAENAVISNGGTGTTAPTSRTVTARATSNDTEAAAPYTRVHFYEVIGGNRRLIGTATTATQIVEPTVRTFDYSITYTPTGVPAGTVQLFAVGVQANGDARRTDNVRTVEIQGTL